MLGQPDPVVSQRSPETTTDRNPADFARPGFVSLWVGTFPSVEEAEAYFGIPDEVGVYLPPEAFAADFGLGPFPPETLEVNFEQVTPRRLADLLGDATFAASFLDPAVEAAARQGIHEAQGVALLYDFDYRLHPARRDSAGPLRFVGAFPFVRTAPRANLRPLQDLAREVGYPVAAVLFTFMALAEATGQRRRERGDAGGHISAREFCDRLLACRGADTPTLLRELGLRRSEDVGRVIFGLVGAGLARHQATESDADFQGLFPLD